MAGGRPAMRHKPTTDPEQKRLLLRTEGGTTTFLLTKRRTVERRFSLNISALRAVVPRLLCMGCVWVVYVCVCVACQYPEHVRSLCQRLQNSLHSNNTSRSPCRVAASQNSADPNICSTFQQQFRYAICLPRPHKS